MRKLRTEMHRCMLGNRYCARAVEVDCHFESICESRSFFVTTIEFRLILQRQRDDTPQGPNRPPDSLRCDPQPARYHRVVTAALDTITRITTTPEVCTAQPGCCRRSSTRRSLASSRRRHNGSLHVFRGSPLIIDSSRGVIPTEKPRHESTRIMPSPLLRTPTPADDSAVCSALCGRQR
jgi:hypothetical protein